MLLCKLWYKHSSQFSISTTESRVHLILTVVCISDCGNPSKPTNGSVSLAVLGTTTYGATATYSCEEGYDLIGDETIECEASGLWSDASTCSIKGYAKAIDPVVWWITIIHPTVISCLMCNCTCQLYVNFMSTWQPGNPSLLKRWQTFFLWFDGESHQIRKNITRQRRFRLAAGYTSFIDTAAGGIATSKSLCQYITMIYLMYVLWYLRA